VLTGARGGIRSEQVTGSLPSGTASNCSSYLVFCSLKGEGPAATAPRVKAAMSKTAPKSAKYLLHIMIPVFRNISCFNGKLMKTIVIEL
jgi:hypothetical protein